MAKKQTKSEVLEVSELIKTAHKRFDEATEHWNDYYQDSQKVLEFIEGSDGAQWDSQLKRNRENMGLPTLTSNQIPTFLRQITNESRQNCPSIQIDPKSEGADQDTAEVFADLIRGIEQSSSAASVYDNASWYAASIGLGFFRLVNEYEKDSFLQKISLKSIPDPMTVLMDPSQKELDGSDMEYCFILTSLSKDEYKRQFPNTALESNNFVGWSPKSMNNRWVQDDRILIAEYYYKDYTTKTLYQVFNTETMQTVVSTDEPNKDLIAAGILEILNTREMEEVTIRQCKINDVEILEETIWPGNYIPVVCVKGDEIWINGERQIKGAVKDAMDSQRVFNYNYSIMAETVSMAPKAPWVLTAKQIEGHEHLWRDANNSTLAYLLYNDIEGSAAPARNNVEPAVQAAIAAMHEASDSMKSIFGMFAASLGQQQPGQEAFRTVLARQQAAHTTTYHFYDNLAKSVEQAGRILVEAIPTFYADERKVQVIKQNGQSNTVTINGDDGRNVIASGDYGVVVETGPSYATRRQDSVAHMLSFSAANPQIPLGDIIADESDWPGAKRIANRIRLTLPPEIQQAEMDNGDLTPAQKVQSSAMQVKQLSNQLQQATQQVQELIAHNKTTDELVKQQHQEINLMKAENRLQLEKHDKENELKKQSLVLEELETELSYKVKMKELSLQERAMQLNEAKLALNGVEIMEDMNNNAHKHAMEHDKHVKAGKITAESVDLDVPGLDTPSISDNVGPNGVQGLDKSFQSMTGPDVGNA